jgi:hypothetical protein
MAEPGMPDPRFFISTRRQANRLCNVDVEHIEPACIATNLGEEATLFISNSQLTVLHQHLVAALVQLADGDNIRRQPWEVVDVVQRPVLVGLAGEQDSASPLDPGD